MHHARHFAVNHCRNIALHKMLWPPRHRFWGTAPPLFPDMVRYGHLIEMLSSMLVFGLISGFVLYKPLETASLLKQAR